MLSVSAVLDDVRPSGNRRLPPAKPRTRRSQRAAPLGRGYSRWVVYHLYPVDVRP